MPGRHHECIARLELKTLGANAHGSGALDDRKHHTVSAAIGLGLESLRQQLNECRDGGHRVPAGQRVDELHLPAVAGVGILVLRHLGERLPAALVRIVEDRRGLAERRGRSHWRQALAEARHRGAFAARYRLHLLRVDLVELGGEGLHDADVEAVHPYHRLVAGIAVVMPGPRRRDDEITRPHRGALAVDRGVGARALDDEAQRRLRMAVARRDLGWQDELQPGVQALRDARLAAHPRVLEDQHAPHRLLGADQLASLHQVGPCVAVLPERRLARRHRLVRDEVVQHFPERRQVVPVHAAVKRLPLRADIRFGNASHWSFQKPRILRV